MANEGTRGSSFHLDPDTGADFHGCFLMVQQILWLVSGIYDTLMFLDEPARLNSFKIATRKWCLHRMGGETKVKRDQARHEEDPS